MPGPDISHLAAMRERFMNDTVKITHNPQALTDQPMDRDTGKPQTQTPDTVYEGKADFVPLTSDMFEEGDNPLGLDYYAFRIPIASDIPQKGDDVEVLTFQRDPKVVGRMLEVEACRWTSYPDSRLVIAQERTPARARAGSRAG